MMRVKRQSNIVLLFVGRRLNQLVHEEKDLKRALEIFQVEMKEECVHQELPHFRHRSPDPGPSIDYKLSLELGTET
jgi:hypothetical protein